MEYKALVSRTIGMADESIRVNIDGKGLTSISLDHLERQITEAFAHADTRAAVQAQRLLEDTTLVAGLTEREYTALMHCVRLLYPIPEVTVSCFDTYVQIELSKLNGSGESLTVQVHNIQPFDNVALALENVWTLLDARLAVSNGRELAHMAFIKQLDYETKLKVIMVMDCLYGRTTPAEVRSRLAQPENDYGQREN